MPAGNAIELFNCSLCQFCETSLDRLATHIRQHIKPDPGQPTTPLHPESPKESIVTPRNYSNGKISSDAPKLNFDSNGENSSIGYFARKSGESTNNTRNVHPDNPSNDDVNSATPWHGGKSSRSEGISPRAEGINTQLPRIEVLNPRTLSSDVSNDRQRQSNQSNAEIYYPPPPPLVEKAPHLSTYSRSHTSQPQNQNQNQRHSNSNFGQQPGRNNAATRYASLQPRESSYPDQKPNRSYTSQQYQHTSYANSNKAAQYMNEFVPIAPAKGSTGYHDMQTIPMEVDNSEKAFRRVMPSSQERFQKKVINHISSPNQRNSSHDRYRSNQSYDTAQQYNFSVRGSKHDDGYYSNANHNKTASKVRSSHSQQLSSPNMQHSPNSHGHPSAGSHGPRRQYQDHISNQQSDHFTSDPRAQQHLSQVQSRLSNIQYSDLKNQNTTNPIGVPNKGTVILNPDQLLSATGNVSLDQLAGLLIVPLKKTTNISTQTDPIEIANPNKKRSDNSINMSCQTDLKMGQIADKTASKSISHVFDNIRSTDSLFECLVCGEESASDHHLQEHISQNHTHVCEKCYHSSLNLNEHNVHVLECGTLSAEMLCMECNSSFTSLKKFNQHRSKVHNVRMPFRCGICNVPFETHEAVMKHIATHDTDQPEFKCRHCVKLFQSAEALSIHVARHKMVEVLHECRFCRKTFNSHSLLQDHIGYLHVISELKDNASPESLYDMEPIPDEARNDTNIGSKKHPLCRHCDLAFKNRELLRRHTDSCSKNRDAKASAFVCDVCKEYFQSDLHRRQHLKQDHRRNNGYRCPKCSKIYRTWSRLKFHTKQQHLKKTCSECDLVFTKEHVLRKHQEDVHGKPQGQPGERVYTCSLCNTMLNTLTELMNHRRDVHPELSSNKSPDQLSPTMTSSASMVRPASMVSVVDNDVPFADIEEEEEDDDGKLSVSKCSDCNEIFTSVKILNDHIRMKHGTTKNRYKCDHCSMTFDDEKRMKNHRGLIHGERLFECNVCDKKFQYSSQVIWHKRCHKGSDLRRSTGSIWKAKTAGRFSSFHKKSAQNHVCQFCGAKFNQEKLLKNHKGAVHKIKLFSCEICDQKFGHSTELIWHLRTCRAKFRRQNPGIELPLAGKQAESSDDGAEVQHMQDDFAPSMANSDFAPTMTDSNYNDGLDDYDLDDDEYALENEGSSSHYKSDMPRLKDSSHRQLSSADAQELLKNEPQYDTTVGEYSCPICQKTTKSITGMKTHYGRCHGVWGKETSHRNNEGHEVSIYPCKYCHEEYTSFEELRTHSSDDHATEITIDQVDIERRHEFVNPDNQAGGVLYTCPHCHISFDNSKAIRVHSFKKHGILLNDAELNTWKGERGAVNGEVTHRPTGEQLRYKCIRCKAKFRTTKSVRIHTFKRHGFILSKKELARCKQWVPSTSLSESPINRNKGRDLVEEPNPCDKCGRVFGNYRALFTHYRQAHRITNENFVPRKPSRTELTSNFLSPEKQENNESESTIPRSHPSPVVSNSLPNSPGTADSVDCPKCSRPFTVHKSLVAHLYSAHKISKDQYADFWPQGVPILPRVSCNCPTCDKECVDKRAMRIHMYKAHGMHFRDFQQLGQSPDSLIMNEQNPDKILNGDEPLEGDDTKLSVDVDINGPPACFICDRLFKGRRALMTHEQRFHGIRWVNLKRIFPEQVRNLPNSDKFSVDKHKYENSMVDVYKEKRSKSTVVTPITPTGGFVCPDCDAKYQNRRAMTTHLCRIHKYKKDDIHAYFDIKPATNQINHKPKSPIEIIDKPPLTNQFLDTNEESDELVIDEAIVDGEGSENNIIDTPVENENNNSNIQNDKDDETVVKNEMENEEVGDTNSQKDLIFSATPDNIV